MSSVRIAVVFLRDAWPPLCLALLMVSISEALKIAPYVHAHRRESTQVYLDRRIPEARYDQKPLQEVLWELDPMLDSRLDVDWLALAREGVHRTTPVIVRLRSPRVARILDVIAGEFEHGQLVWWRTEPGRIRISTERERQLQPTAFKRYDVRALRLQSSDCFDPEPRDPKIDYSDEELGEQLCLLVRDTIDTNSWTENGGLIGRVTYSDGHLYVSQIAENQRATEILVRQLLESRAAPIESFFRNQRLQQAGEE